MELLVQRSAVIISHPPAFLFHGNQEPEHPSSPFPEQEENLLAALCVRTPLTEGPTLFLNAWMQDEGREKHLRFSLYHFAFPSRLLLSKWQPSQNVLVSRKDRHWESLAVCQMDLPLPSNTPHLQNPILSLLKKTLSLQLGANVFAFDAGDIDNPKYGPAGKRKECKIVTW